MAPPREAPPQAHEPHLWPVEGRHLDALNAIADGLALVHSMLGDDANLGIAPLHILAGEHAKTRDLVGPVSLLAETLVEGASNAHVSGSREAERSAAIESIRTAIERAHFRATPRARKDVLDDAGQLIHEIGLERHGLQCILGADRGETRVIATNRVPSPVVDAWLIESLLQRMEAFVAVDETLSLERNASAWFFECWSEGDDGDQSYSDYPRGIREQEWSLVSRDTLALDEPVIASFTIDQEPDDVPPRQQRLATAYARSTIGIYEIVAVDGLYVTIRDTITGQTHRYHEHAAEADPYPGLLILGRMIPLEDDLWVRSPGAMMISPGGNEFRDSLSTSLTQMSETLPTPIALEWLISTAVFGANVPVSILPAPTVAAARAGLDAAQETLIDLGLLDDTDVPTTLQGMAEQLESPALESFALAVDQPVAEWLMALYEQAALDTRMPDRQAAKRKKPRRAKQQPTRRRKR
jgi:hypothetical protein